MSSSDRVAVVGTGAMGSRIAGRLLDAGHQVTIWNRTPEKMASLVALGALPAATPARAAREAEAVITMVSDPAALRAVTERPHGVAAGMSKSTTVIEMSTVGVAAVRRLAGLVVPAAAGVLDAPVMGSLAEADQGSLRIFVGGNRSLFERWRPLLVALGSPLHVGELGSGAAAKLVANGALFGTLALLGEALAFAEGLGLSRESAFDVLAATPLAEQAERRRAVIETGAYPMRFALALALKDADLIAEAALDEGIDLPLAAAVRSRLVQAKGADHGEQDYSAVIAYILGAVRTGRLK